MNATPDIWLVNVGGEEIQCMIMTQFENAACNVCLGNVMIYTGNGKGHDTNTVETSIKEGDEEMKKKKNRKDEKR
jgi:hypothetical protein